MQNKGWEAGLSKSQCHHHRSPVTRLQLWPIVRPTLTGGKAFEAYHLALYYDNRYLKVAFLTVSVTTVLMYRQKYRHSHSDLVLHRWLLLDTKKPQKLMLARRLGLF